MSYTIDRQLCTDCGTCALVCPVDAIGTDGIAISIDGDLCILCGACDMHCPQGAILFDGERQTPFPYPISLPDNGILNG